jgi:hypothetical protein
MIVQMHATLFFHTSHFIDPIDSSTNPTIHNTAAATINQIVGFVFEKVFSTLVALSFSVV